MLPGRSGGMRWRWRGLAGSGRAERDLNPCVPWPPCVPRRICVCRDVVAWRVGSGSGCAGGRPRSVVRPLPAAGSGRAGRVVTPSESWPLCEPRPAAGPSPLAVVAAHRVRSARPAPPAWGSPDPVRGAASPTPGTVSARWARCGCSSSSCSARRSCSRPAGSWRARSASAASQRRWRGPSSSSSSRSR